MIPSLLAASDVLGTGWFAAVAGEAGSGKTVAVVGDGAVGLLAVLAGADAVAAVEQKARALLAQVDAYRDVSTSLAIT
jgi:threonine dehydrogenase-like Zn-dependent dehydrogenase